MKQTTLILLGILFFCECSIWSQVQFLGFEQTQCATEKDYSIISTSCGSHSWGYAVLRGDSWIYESPCPGVIGDGYNATDLRFLNDSVGFLLEGARTDNGNSIVAAIKKTTDYGTTWESFRSNLNRFGPNSFSEYYVLNEEEVVHVCSPEYAEIGHLIIDGIVDSIDNDTIITLSKLGNSDCGIDTLEFSVTWNNDTVDYKLALEFSPLSIEILEANEFSIYPNPAENVINLRLIENIEQVELFEISGRKIKTITDLQSNQIDISDLRNGIYILQISTHDTKASVKIIKE